MFKKLHIDYKKRIEDIFIKYNVTKYEIEYYYEVFGNFVIKFEFKKKYYYIVTDRGEVYLNDVCIVTGKYDYVNLGLVTTDFVELIINKILERNSNIK